MTNTEAIKIIAEHGMLLDTKTQCDDIHAFNMAINALSALDDIKAEIQKALDEDKATDTENAKVQAIALMWCLEVIDKYTGGTDENNH